MRSNLGARRLRPRQQYFVSWPPIATPSKFLDGPEICGVPLADFIATTAAWMALRADSQLTRGRADVAFINGLKGTAEVVGLNRAFSSAIPDACVTVL